jgi:outer membrane biogenesis lipoprotein LolB
MKPRQGIALIMVLTVLTLTGCTPRVSVEEWTASTSPGDRVAMLHERAGQWEGYQAVLHISAESTKGTLRRIRTMVLAAPPDTLRMEALNPFGYSVGVLLLERDQASLWIPSEKAVYTAGRPETLIQHLLGIPIPIETFVYSLAGVVPRKYLNDVQSEPMSSGWRLKGQDPAEPWTTTWEFGVNPFTLRQIRVIGESQEITVRYEPAVDLTARNVPDRLVFSSSDWKLEVKVDQIQSVKEFQGGAFQVNYPGGLRQIDLDRAGWKGTGL